MSTFNLNDIVTKKYGKKTATIISLPTNLSGYGWQAQYVCKYTESNNTFRARGSELKLASETDSSSSSPLANMKTLYSFTKSDGTTGYGTYLATNSASQLVVEEKGTGAILTFDKDQLEEVLPYTFAVKVNGKETHYMGDANSTLKKGDVVMLTDPGSNYAIGVVSGVDTKNRAPREKFKGVKLVTEAI
jgi:hypothetical protein